MRQRVGAFSGNGSVQMSLKEIGPESAFSDLADVLEGPDKVVEKLDWHHDGVAPSPHVLGDLYEFTPAVLLEIKKEDLAIRQDFLRVDGSVIRPPFVLVVPNHCRFPRQTLPCRSPGALTAKKLHISTLIQCKLP
jgi:hypothetical protein